MILFNKVKALAKSYRNNIAIKYYKKKIRADEDIAKLIKGFKELDTHYADYKLEGKNVILHVGIQLAELINSAHKQLKEGYKSKMFLDAGDSDGIVLQSLEIENRISLNISKECAILIKENGGTAIVGDLEHLPFKSKCFDGTICFETLEHLENPIKGLHELARVTKRLFLSIPWMKRTRINKQEIDHAFEFSHEDFGKILTYTDFKIKYYKEINIFPRIFNPLDYSILRLFYFRSFFPKLQFYELTKEEAKDV